jgi:benzylsuccinate CoA-transferase BbsE subunit
MAAALDGLRVLELSGLYGAYCGKLFADLGAAVTLIEPPAGSPMRVKPPIAEDGCGERISLTFAYFAANKASVVLDLTAPAAVEALQAMARDADLVILSDHPDARHVDLEAIRLASPKLVCTRITPYGATGPYANFAGDDLTLMAMGGLLTMAGFPDEPPVVAHGEQGLLAGDQFAAVASLAAVLHAERTGEGELIDVSIQEAIVMALENAAQTYQLEGKVRNRTAGARRAGSGIFPCRDGEVYLLAGGIGETAMWSNFAQWMAADGVEGAEIFASPTWSDTAPHADDAFRRLFLPYAATRTKNELYARGKQWRVPIAPMSTPVDLLENRQLLHRGFFVPLPSGNPAVGIKVPGAPYKLNRTPWQLCTAAPKLGATADATAPGESDA